LLIALLMAASGILSASAGVPGQFHYQGRLIVADKPVNGNIPLRFRLFDVEDGGEPLYEEKQTITIVDGFYSAYIGAVTPVAPEVFRDHEAVYLEIEVDGQVILPRERIVAVGYALSARYAEEARVAHRLVEQPAPAVVEAEGGGPVPHHVNATTNVTFHVHMNSIAQTITTEVEHKLNWQSKEFDTASAVNLSSDQFVAPVDGYYRLTAQVVLTPVALKALSKHDQKFVKLQLRHNGTVISSFIHRTSGKGSFSLLTARDRFLSSGDYVEVYVRQNTSAQYTAGGSSAHTYFSGFLMQQ
jgi:hypothetical protein